MSEVKGTLPKTESRKASKAPNDEPSTGRAIVFVYGLCVGLAVAAGVFYGLSQAI